MVDFMASVSIKIIGITDSGEFPIGSIRQLHDGKWTWHGLGRVCKKRHDSQADAESAARRAFGKVRFESTDSVAEQFKVARYGYFDDGLVFHEVAFDDIKHYHPFLSRMRWIGGAADYLLAQAVEKLVLAKHYGGE
jgi:hypothetical protein